MIEPMLYILMGFLAGTAFGSWAALSVRKARFGKGAETCGKPTPAQTKAMPWKERAKEYDLPFKETVRKGLRIGALKEQGVAYERYIVRFKCRGPKEYVDCHWALLPNGSLYPRMDIHGNQREYTYSEFLSLDMSVDPMEILRDRINRYEGNVEAKREAEAESEAMKALDLELALNEARP